MITRTRTRHVLGMAVVSVALGCTACLGAPQDDAECEDRPGARSWVKPQAPARLDGGCQYEWRAALPGEAENLVWEGVRAFNAGYARDVHGSVESSSGGERHRATLRLSLHASEAQVGDLVRRPRGRRSCLDPYRLPYTLELDIDGEPFIVHDGVAEGTTVMGHFGIRADEVVPERAPFPDMAPLRAPVHVTAKFDLGRAQTRIDIRESERSTPSLSFAFR